MKQEPASRDKSHGREYHPRGKSDKEEGKAEATGDVIVKY
jgi:hypothetical protein